MPTNSNIPSKPFFFNITKTEHGTSLALSSYFESRPGARPSYGTEVRLLKSQSRIIDLGIHAPSHFSPQSYVWSGHWSFEARNKTRLGKFRVPSRTDFCLVLKSRVMKYTQSNYTAASTGKARGEPWLHTATSTRL